MINRATTILGVVRRADWVAVTDRVDRSVSVGTGIAFFVFASLSFLTIADLSAIAPFDDLVAHPFTRMWAQEPVEIRIIFVYAPLVLYFLHWISDAVGEDDSPYSDDTKNLAVRLIFSVGGPILITGVFASERIAVFFLLYLAFGVACGAILVIATDVGEKLREAWDRRRAAKAGA